VARWRGRCLGRGWPVGEAGVTELSRPEKKRRRRSEEDKTDRGEGSQVRGEKKHASHGRLIT
jgi:hypothetical protein